MLMTMGGNLARRERKRTDFIEKIVPLNHLFFPGTLSNAFTFLRQTGPIFKKHHTFLLWIITYLWLVIVSELMLSFKFINFVGMFHIGTLFDSHVLFSLRKASDIIIFFEGLC